MSNITDAKRELQELKAEMQIMQREMRAYRHLLYEVTSLGSLLGLKSASDIRQMIILLYRLKAAYDAVQIARLAAGDPLAWIGAGVSVATTVVNVADLVGARG